MNNLLKRTLTGIGFVALMVAGMLVKYVFPILMMLIMFGMLREFFEISVGKGVLTREKIFAYIAGLGFFALIFCVYEFGMKFRFVTLVLLPLVAMLTSFIFEKDHSYIDKLAFLFYGLLYISLPIGLIPLLVYYAGPFDGRLLLSLFIMIWMSDVGAYCIGSMLGQRPGAKKLAPAISPKKSWWGVAGGAIFCAGAAVALHFAGWLPFGLIHCLILSLVVCFGDVVGDLAESVWKRHFGVKDSGNSIPGHGGFLDRFDSSIIAIPLGGIYMAIFALL